MLSEMAICFLFVWCIYQFYAEHCKQRVSVRPAASTQTSAPCSITVDDACVATVGRNDVGGAISWCRLMHIQSPVQQDTKTLLFAFSPALKRKVHGDFKVLQL